ncbi:hypothetical protein ACOM2C_02865 [Pseudarthrobacter sp. So.54]
MRAEIDDVGSLAELASPDVVAARIDRLGADVSRRDLTERLLENTGAPDVIAGLRHRNLDPAFPFVAVKTTARVNNAEAVDVLAARVSQSYRGAGVRGFTFWEQPGLDFAGTENWATVMAGSVKTATRAGAEQDPGHPLTAFWPDDATDLIPGYHREQRAWRADAPGLAPFVSESSQEALQAAADLGLLMTLRDRHGFAGLAAATIAPLFGRRAVCMLDVFLADRLRGTGLAPVMHSWFLAKASARGRTPSGATSMPETCRRCARRRSWAAGPSNRNISSACPSKAASRRRPVRDPWQEPQGR